MEVNYSDFEKEFMNTFYDKINEHLGSSSLKQHMMDYVAQSLRETIIKLSKPIIDIEKEEGDK
jgi:hypothetical protein